MQLSIINHTIFLDFLTQESAKLGINLDEFQLDHIAYQTSNSEEYEKMKAEFLNYAELVREPLVDERRVGVFKLKQPLVYKENQISVIELIEPRSDTNPPSALEHAEYLFPLSLEEFMQAHPDVEFDTRALNRTEFPQLILKLTDSIRVKFPRQGILTA